MTTRFATTCDTCGFTGTYRTEAQAAYALRRHSCEKHVAAAEAAERGRRRMAAVDRTPKTCHHPRANHQHGTYACYTLDACRCPDCCTAVREYERDRTRRQAYGRWDNLTDATPARDHVRRLMAAGMGIKRIGTVANVSTGVLSKLLYGKARPDGSPRHPTRRLSKAVAARLLAVDLDLADGAKVPNTDTARRLQALVANGWSMSELGRRLGVAPGNFNPVILGHRREVTVATAKAVHRLYQDLADQTPATDTAGARGSVSRARRYAAARGWAPPLRINGRIHIGQPLPLPDLLEDADVVDLTPASFDEAAVERRLAGDRTAQIRRPERLEIVRRAREAGWSLRDLEIRAGITKPDRYLPPAGAREAS